MQKYCLRLTKSDIEFINYALANCPLPFVVTDKNVARLEERRGSVLEKIRSQTEAQDEWLKKMGWTKEKK